MLSKIFKFVLLIIVLAVAITIFCYYEDINSPAGTNVEKVSFIVTPGEGVKKISKNLLNAGLIKSEVHFNFYVHQVKKESLIQAGTYELSPTMTIKDITRILSAGQTVGTEREVTIIPGWTLRDVADYFAKQGITSQKDFYKLTGEPLKNYQSAKLENRPKDFSTDFAVLSDKPQGAGLEGYLFPDTYRVYQDASVEDVIGKMLSNLQSKLTPQMLSDIKAQGKTVYQIITMASVIEKEVSKKDDMKIVSGIFTNRMKIGQPLQSCATLAYILGENKPIYSLEDTKVDSPYNTYRHQGLPPGPICNPSLQAIEAAIYPVKTDYGYFLSRPDTGETVFSKTLEEHNRNKAKYLK
jgi:UPF0755 protein